jgi:hypothetical protein
MLPPDEHLGYADEAPAHQVPQLLSVRQVYADVTLVHRNAEPVEDVPDGRTLLERLSDLTGMRKVTFMPETRRQKEGTGALQQAGNVAC